MQNVAAAHGITGDHRHHRLWRAADLNVQIADVQATDALSGHLVVADVAVVAADLLVAARAECLVAGAREDDRSNLEIVAGACERVPELGKRLWSERISALGPVDRDLGDPL